MKSENCYSPEHLRSRFLATVVSFGSNKLIKIFYRFGRFLRQCRQHCTRQPGGNFSAEVSRPGTLYILLLLYSFVFFGRSRTNPAIHMIIIRRNVSGCPGWCGSVDGVLAGNPTVPGFDSQSGPVPALWARPPRWGRARGNQSMYLSHIDVFLPLFLPHFPAL